MLNAEKYRDEIYKRAENHRKDFFTNTYPLSMAVDEICKSGLTLEKTIEWLLSEYEPPLLKNADGLKTGDRIMVSNDKYSWRNRQFLYFWEGYFFATNLSTSPEQAQAVKWSYARLPEEGE